MKKAEENGMRMEVDRIYCMDALEGTKQLDDNSIDCVITSPPYWGLRDYGTAKWEGGNPNCNHKDGVALAERLRQKKSMIEVGERIDGSTRTRIHDEKIGNGIQYKNICGKCGAKRIDQQIGLEKTPEEYTEKLVNIFREIHRVLKSTGTVWLNLGDSYNPSPSNQQYKNVGGGIHGSECTLGRKKRDVYGLKPKDLVGIPWRVAFALQTDGWWLRQDIIWAKPNPMPESVTDRCTKSHEYIFLLTKSKDYYYDAEAIREPQKEASLERYKTPLKIYGNKNGGKDRNDFGRNAQFDINSNGRNKRSVWTITTHPYKEAHFATYPPALIEPMIKAGTSEKGVCPVCKKPWKRVIEKKGGTIGKSWHNHTKDLQCGMSQKECSGLGDKINDNGEKYTITPIGWEPTCTCDKEPIPAIVLDPFIGSGTTALVARKLLRHYIGFDINSTYCDMARKRINKIPQRLESFAVS